MPQLIDGFELVLRVYDSVFDRAQVPTAEELASQLEVDRASVLESIQTAKLGKTLLPDPETGEIWMAGPFAGRPTDHRVTSGTHAWWANCAWDAFGVAALLNRPVEIQTRCGDCGKTMTLTVDPTTQTIGDPIVHFLVPARNWYADIGFT